MRVVFMGTPAFGVPPLRALVEHGYEVVGVFCQPDKPKGRGNKLAPCPVKELAVSLGIPVFQPKRIRLDGAQDLKNLTPDVCVTAAFGQILSQENLDVPRIGTINVHASLLPKYRGSAPINWALINGEKVTGVTTMLTDKGLDTGDILMQTPYAIKEDMSAGELTDALSVVGAQLLLETLERLQAGTCPRKKQDESQMTYYPMLKKEMGQLNFNNPAETIVHLIRGIDPWPGAYAYAGDETIKVWKASVVPCADTNTPGQILCADAQQGLIVRAGKDAVKIEQMQVPGGKRMDATVYLRGNKMKTDRFERREEHA